MYDPGRCIARDVQSFPPPACEIAFAGSNSIGLAFARGIFEQEGWCVWLEEENCFFLMLFLFFLNSWFICLLNYLFAFPLQSSFDCLTWKYGYKADDRSLP